MRRQLLEGDRLKTAYYSANFAEARQRFVEAALTVGADVSTYQIQTDPQDDLTIDVAVIGPEGAPTVVVSSGVHGVEGLLGSAVQLALLTQRKQSPDMSRTRYVLIHSLNPFGFTHRRRFNEDNVDLNRNFHKHANDYHGAPAGYARLHGFLNPESPPARWEPLRLKAAWHIAWQGLPALKRAIAGGQYEYPRGIFFGGHGPCQSTQIVSENCERWIGSSSNIIHLDFHSGLGAFGKYKLLLTESAKSDHYAWYADTFNARYVEPVAEEETAYKVAGLFGPWMQDRFRSRNYRFAYAEFGTYGLTRIVAAIRAENRAHHYGDKHSQGYQLAKAELQECFCPQDDSWRKQVIESGLEIVRQAAHAWES